MSLIVAIKKGDTFYLGADTRTTRGERISTVRAQGDLKIQRIGSCLIGAAGTVANIQLMLGHPEWFELNGDPLSKKFIVREIVPRYYDLVKEMGKLDAEEQNSDTPKCGCSFLVTDGKKLFVIDDDFEVVELSRYGQIGCTSQTALTILMHMPDGSDPNETILRALRASTYRNEGVGAPYILINTKDNQFEVVEE